MGRSWQGIQDAFKRYPLELQWSFRTSQPMIITPPQSTPHATAEGLPRNTETPTAGVLLHDQNGDGNDQHHNEEEDQVRDFPVVETSPVGDPDARPNMRYPDNVFDLSSVGTKSRRTPRRAKRLSTLYGGV